MFIRGTFLLCVGVLVTQGCNSNNFAAPNNKKAPPNAADANPIAKKPEGADPTKPNVIGRDVENHTNNPTSDLENPGFTDPQAYKDLEDRLKETPDEPGESTLGDIGKDVDGLLWLPCDKTKKEQLHKTDFSGKKATTLRVSGEFCLGGGEEGALTVLFIVDFSTSMIGSTLSTTVPANDPTTAASCGRLNAAAAVVNELIKQNPGNAAIKVGVVGFSNDASVRIPLGAAADVQKQFNEKTLCGADGAAAATNYQAGFEVAQQTLTGVTGPVAIYLISDGKPTKSRTGDPETAGTTAAQAVKASNPELVINAVFLGYNGTDATNPQGLLQTITGSPDRVKLVANASDVVEKIKDLKLPTTLKKANTAALWTVVGKDDKTLNVTSFKKTKKGRYLYVTDIFTPVGTKGEAVVNTVSISVKTANGDTLKSTTEIAFTIAE